MTKKQRLVIIGNGMAGARLAEEVLARQGSDLFDIVVFGAESYGNYNRILLSGVLAGTHDPKDIFINPLHWYKEHSITFHAGSAVNRIDRAAQMVYSEDGKAEAYDKLVIATGSDPFVPPLKNLYQEDGRFKTGVFVFRTLDDCAEMIKASEQVKKVAVIGGGLLGLEAARGMLNRGLEVHVIHMLPHLMNIQLDPAASVMLKKTMLEMGLNLHLDKMTVGVEGDQQITGLVCSDGSVIECDMCIMSAGIRPNTKLAREAGLLVERGIVVNDSLATST